MSRDVYVALDQAHGVALVEVLGESRGHQGNEQQERADGPAHDDLPYGCLLTLYAPFVNIVRTNADDQSECCATGPRCGVRPQVQGERRGYTLRKGCTPRGAPPWNAGSPPFLPPTWSATAASWERMRRGRSPS